MSSNPIGAKTYLDGAYKGTAPLTLNNIPIGTHSIRLATDGYNDKTKSITVTNGGTVTVSGTLAQKTGSIVVSSTPSGANIYIDNNYKGTSPVTVDDVTLGDHDVKVTQTGYNDETMSVHVKAGASESISKTLTPIAKIDDSAPKVDSTPAKEVVSPPGNPSTGNNSPLLIYGAGAILFLLFVTIMVKKTKSKDHGMVITNDDSTGLKQSSSKSMPTPVITSAFGYKGATIQYKIKVENPTSEPIADIKVNLYVPDVFLASESSRTITMLKPGEGKTATFEI
ncbi:MAG: PEGA domain-containing protein, partial [Methanosarcinales archaeon]|nr:PEGA domain-containing protein [Methanosarcinales archaeon]